MNLSALASLLSLAFAAVVADRWRRTRRPAFAAWAAGLLVFAAAAATQAAGEQGGFTPGLFRAFYLLGGALGVIYLALGTLYLLTPRRVADVCAAGLLLLSVVLAVDAAVIPVDASSLSTPAGILGGAIDRSSLLHVAVIVLNIVGTVVLVGGSAWSAIVYARSRAGLDRVVCNSLLTVGALVIAAGFSAAKTVGSTLSTLGAYEAIGMAVMFAGFLSLGRIGQNSPAGSTLSG